MKKSAAFLILLTLTHFCSQAQYLPLSGGTLTGNLNMATGTQIQSSFYGFNNGFTQPATSSNVAIFTNNSTTTMDFVGWNNGWRFVPVSASSYPAPVVTFSPNGNAVFGNTVNGLPAGGSALILRGPNSPANSGSFQDINYSFNNAGSARIRAYRGSSWDTYLQFLVNKVGQGSDAPTVAMHIDQTGNVGIGTTSPGATLHVEGSLYTRSLNIKAPTGNCDVVFETANGNARWDLVADQNTFTAGLYDVLSNTFPFGVSKGAPNYCLFVNGAGNVLMGKNTQTNTAYKLDINGSARANKVVVNTTGADFVFDSSYDLKSLSTVESYIKTNKHLPDIEPADQMQKEGVDLGAIQTKLLQKIEELTLYLIDQKKEIASLKKDIIQLQKDSKK